MRHLLIVDDEPEVIEGLMDILRPLRGIVLHTALLASQALQMLRSFSFSLVIADIRMPGMNGIEMWEEIEKHVPQCRVIFLSGVRDFDPIYRIIQSPNARFLTKMEPEEKILQTVGEVLAEIQEQEEARKQEQQRAVLRYLSGTEDEKSDARERLSQNTGPVDVARGAHVVLLEIAHAWAFPPQERKQALAQIESCVSQASREEREAFLSLRLENTRVLWLTQSSPEAEEAERFSRRLDGLCSALEQQMRMRLGCLFGQVFSWESLLGVYLEAQEVGFPMDLPSSRVLSLDQARREWDGVDRAKNLKSQLDLQTLQGYLRLGQKQSFLHLLQTLFAGFGEGAQVNAAPALQAYFGTLALLHQSLEKVEGAESLQRRLRSETSLSLSRYPSLESVMQRLLAFGAEAMELLFPTDPYASADVVTRLQQYVQEHLDQDLSLNALSERFSMNPGYLSRMFRETTGRRLHEYITQLRLGTAERLLRASGQKVQEIARRVGYDSAHTFIRAFRKQYGKTPVEYRSEHMENRPS